MSFVVNLQHAILHSDLPAPARHLMLSLAVKADWESGVIPPEYTPALSTLVAMTGLSKSTIAEWLDALETGGWIKRNRPPKASGNTRTRYTLLIGGPNVATPARASRRHRTTEAAGDLTGGPAPNDHSSHDSSGFGGSPGGHVRQADNPSCPPGEPSLCRLADTGGPPGGHAPSENSPSESSTFRDSPRRDRGQRLTSAVTSGQAGIGSGSRLPDDFLATDDMIAWARENTPDVGRAATEAFIDYWKAQPGRRGRKTDWLATWRNWMRREQADIERRPSFRGTPVQTAVDAIASPQPTAEDMCPEHRGRRASACGLCRAERIAAQ